MEGDGDSSSYSSERLIVVSGVDTDEFVVTSLTASSSASSSTSPTLTGTTLGKTSPSSSSSSSNGVVSMMVFDGRDCPCGVADGRVVVVLGFVSIHRSIECESISIDKGEEEEEEVTTDEDDDAIEATDVDIVIFSTLLSAWSIVSSAILLVTVSPLHYMHSPVSVGRLPNGGEERRWDGRTRETRNRHSTTRVLARTMRV